MTKFFPLLYDSSAYARVPPAVYVDLLSGVNPDVGHKYSGNNHMPVGWVGLGMIWSMTSYMIMEVLVLGSCSYLLGGLFFCIDSICFSGTHYVYVFANFQQVKVRICIDLVKFGQRWPYLTSDMTNVLIVLYIYIYNLKNPLYWLLRHF